MSAGRVRDALARPEAGGRPPAAGGRVRPLPGERGGAAATRRGAVSVLRTAVREELPAAVRGMALSGTSGCASAAVRGVVPAGAPGAAVTGGREPALPGRAGGAPAVLPGAPGSPLRGRRGAVLPGVREVVFGRVLVMTLCMGSPFRGSGGYRGVTSVGDLVWGRRGRRQERTGRVAGAGKFTYPGDAKGARARGCAGVPGESRDGGGRVREHGAGLERGRPARILKTLRSRSRTPSGAVPSPPSTTTKAASHACLRAPDPPRSRRGVQDG